jgi:hypothetical protein
MNRLEMTKRCAYFMRWKVLRGTSNDGVWVSTRDAQFIFNPWASPAELHLLIHAAKVDIKRHEGECQARIGKRSKGVSHRDLANAVLTCIAQRQATWPGELEGS